MNSYVNSVRKTMDDDTLEPNKSIDEIQPANELKLSVRIRLPAAVDVRGLAKIRRRLYVLTYLPNRILVYAEQGTYVLVGEVKVGDIYGPQEMTGCDVTRCLYVTDTGNRCVWKIAEVDYRTTRWLDHHSWTLRALRDGRVVMPRWVQPFSLELYRPDGVLIRRVPLAADVEIPKHIVENSKGSLVLSHWDGRRKAWGISEVSLDGETIRTYDPGNDIQQLDDPCCLSIDPENRIYVADCHNRNRVILLDSQLKWNASVLTGSRSPMMFPKLLLYSRTRRQLLVIQGSRRKVLDVFSVDGKAKVLSLNIGFKEHS